MREEEEKKVSLSSLSSLRFIGFIEDFLEEEEIMTGWRKIAQGEVGTFGNR
jgi:hypothetical protein